MAHCFDRRLGDSFIAKREIPHPNGEEKNTQIYYISRSYNWCAGSI